MRIMARQNTRTEVGSLNATDGVEAYLQALALRCGNKIPKGWKYKSVEEFILKHGRRCQPRPLPEGVRYGVQRHCFYNSYQLMMNNPEELTYCEGMAGRYIPIHHAWCVDKKGNVVDSTWRWREQCKPDQYYGVSFKFEYVLSCALRSKVYGILWNINLRDWDFMRVNPIEWKGDR